jgi:acylphosphatase
MSDDAAMQTMRMRVRVRGRVQGVYFRAATRERARALGVVGSVRNRDDGSVEIEAEGAAAAVEALVSWARQGPAAARVDDVQVESLPPRSDESEFRIRG